ncbi:MAG: flagellin FliC [Deltaproteobacteria bacterium]|nr:flagellin FliC [Deltaproteobacteria bacterium]
MGLVINTNVGAINAQRNLGRTQSSLSTSMARLSSGMRITAAKDDAAGLAISEKLRGQIRGLAQAERNANDGISMVQTAEGALNEVGGALIRMRELAVQASTGTLGDTERDYLEDEFLALVSEIDRIAAVTEFNGTQLLDGTASTGVSFQVGLDNVVADTITASIGNTYASQLGTTGAIDDQHISTAALAKTSLAVIDAAIGDISNVRGDLGAVQNRLSITVNNLATQRENLSAANSRIRDVDVATETVSMTRSQILMQAGVAVLAQANQMPAMALSLIG